MAPDSLPTPHARPDDAQQRLDGLLYAALDCVVSADRHGRIVEFNPAAERAFGLAAEHAIGRPLAETIIPPEYRDRHHAGMQLSLDAGQVQSPGRRMELEALRADGSRFPCELTLTRQSVNGEPIFTAFIRDITNQRSFEDRIRNLNLTLESEVAARTKELSQAIAKLQQTRDQLERAQEIALIGDSVFYPHSGLRIWSRETFRLYGFSIADRAPAANQIIASISATDLLADKERIESSITSDHPDPEIEYRVVHPDGSRRWLRVVSLVEPSESGDDIRVVSTIQDITKQKAAEQEMLQAIERERELGQLKSDFLNMITHEYRTPLGIINSAADILARYHDRLDDADRIERIADIKQSARRLANLVEEVLFLGKSESGKMAINLRPIDYERLLRETADSIVAQFGAQRDLEYDIQALPEGCRSDEQLVRHILNNAISNALKYSTLDKPVSLSLAPQDDGVRIAVRDQGIGIPSADQAKLFSMFHRAANVGTISGTGLGLVILKRCVDHLAGRVSLKSEPGKGTEISIWLPARLPTST